MAYYDHLDPTKPHCFISQPNDATRCAVCNTHHEQAGNVLLEITDEAGNVDLCECEPAPSTRVVRVIRRVRDSMDRGLAITRALSAFWCEIETIYPRTMYHGISGDTFNALRKAALDAVTERVSEPGRPGLPDPEHDGEMANNYVPVVAEAMAEQAIDARIAEANERTEDEPEEDEPEAEDEPFTDHPEIPPCPACTNGFGVLLGQLGNLVHFRCRNCGMTFNIQAGK